MGSFGGGLARGLANGIQQGQKLRLQQQQQQQMSEYYDLQKEEVKRKAKLDEVKLEKEQRELALRESIIKPIFEQLGISIPQGQPQEAAGVAQQLGSQPPANLVDQIAYWKTYFPETAKLPDNVIANWIKTESNFDPRATSPKGAMGLTQLMPGTALAMGVRDPYDTNENLRGGFRYLDQQLAQFKDPRLALAAYNAGPEAVIKHGGVPPYKETQNYVQKVVGGQEQAPAARTNEMMRNPLVVALFNQAMGGKFDYNPGSYKFEDVSLGGSPGRAPIDPVTGRPDMSKAIPQPVKLDTVDIETKDGETWTYNKNPYTGEIDMSTPPVRKKPAQGKSSAEAGKIQLAQTGLAAFDESMGIIFTPDGQIDWANLANAAAGTPKTKGRNLKGLMKNAIDGIVRAATGAALNPSELDYYIEVYVPSPLDDEKTVHSKLTRLEGFLNGYLEKMDPNGTMRVRTGPVPQAKDKGGKSNPEAEADAWLKGQ